MANSLTGTTVSVTRVVDVFELHISDPENLGYKPIGEMETPIAEITDALNNEPCFGSCMWRIRPCDPCGCDAESCRCSLRRRVTPPTGGKNAAVRSQAQTPAERQGVDGHAVGRRESLNYCNLTISAWAKRPDDERFLTLNDDDK